MAATRQQQQPLKQRRGPAATRALVLGAACAAALVLVTPLLSFVGSSTGAPAGQLRRPLSNYGSRGRATIAALGKASASEAKASLLDLLDDEAVSQEVLRPEGKPTKGRVDEAIVALERFNTCSEPVYSELLDGTWKVKFSGSYAPGLLSSPTRELALFLYGGGFSLGNALSSFAEGFWGQSLGVKLGSKTVRIQGGRDVDAAAEVVVAGTKRTFSYTAELMPLSAERMSEEVVTVELPEPLGKQDLLMELRRSILVTYLDEDVMVVRDESGVPDVLVREAYKTGEPGPAGKAATPKSNETSAADDAEGDEEMGADDPMSSGAS